MRALPAGPVGFVLLGAGAGARAHAEALATLPGARLVAVVDPDLGRARRLAQPHGRTLLAAFVASLRAGRAPSPGGAAAVRIQRVLDAVYAATRTGARTTVAD